MTPNSKHNPINKGIEPVSSDQMRMLKDNLRRSYAERIRRHQFALETMEKLQRAKFL
jgi:hypothetical protein